MVNGLLSLSGSGSGRVLGFNSTLILNKEGHWSQGNLTLQQNSRIINSPQVLYPLYTSSV